MSKVNIKAIFGCLKFCIGWKKKCTEFKVHLIHRKHAPLLHNTLLTLCDEGAGLKAVSYAFLFFHIFFSEVTPVIDAQRLDGLPINVFVIRCT